LTRYERWNFCAGLVSWWHQEPACTRIHEFPSWSWAGWRGSIGTPRGLDKPDEVPIDYGGSVGTGLTRGGKPGLRVPAIRIQASPQEFRQIARSGLKNCLDNPPSGALKFGSCTRLNLDRFHPYDDDLTLMASSEPPLGRIPRHNSETFCRPALWSQAPTKSPEDYSLSLQRS
jgi:hypothetical protein